MIRNCNVCGKEFYTVPAKLKTGRGKYCSIICRGVACRGEKNSQWKGGVDRKQFKEQRKEYMKKWRNKRAIDIFNHYGKKCSCLACGFDDFEFKINGKRFLNIDHIDGGG